MRVKRFLGCQYPLVKTPRGIMAQKNGISQIKADLLQLLLTNPGERVMLPEYGTPLRKLIFEPNDAVLEMEARNMIVKTIEQWEPRIDLQGVEVTSSFNDDDLHMDDTREDKEHILGIKILFYDPLDISEIQELVLQVPISGG